MTDRASFAIHLQGVHFQGRVVLLNGCVGRLQNDICVRSVFPSTDNDVVVIGLVGVRGCMIAGTSKHTRSIPRSFKEFAMLLFVCERVIRKSKEWSSCTVREGPVSWNRLSRPLESLIFDLLKSYL